MILELLEYAGVEVHHSSADNEINICCPFCEDRGESADTRFRLGINTVTGASHCFNCRWKARGVAWTTRQLSRGYRIKFDVLGAFRKQAIATVEPEPKPEVMAEPEIVGLPEGYEAFSKHPNAVERKARAYLHARGISTLQVVKHRMGYAEAGRFSHRILIPVFNGKDLVGCVGRSFAPGIKPKYLNTTGIKSLWGSNRTGQTAVVVEGIFDALRVETVLLRNRGFVAVARLGSAITQREMDQLKEYERVVVFPDHDEAGVHGARELCTRCTSRGIPVSIVVPPAMTGRDPGDMTESEIDDLLRSAVVWNTSAELKLKLSATKRV